MSKPLSSHEIGTLIGIVLILAVLGLAVYLYIVKAKVADAPNVARTYNLTAIQEMETEASKNVFLKTVPLQDVPQSNDSSVQYNSDDLGKKDLIRFE